MKDIHMRILKNKDFTEVNSEGVLQFKKGFTINQINKNTFYQIANTDKIIQLNTDIAFNDCQLTNFHFPDYIDGLDFKKMFSVVKNMLEAFEDTLIVGSDDDINTEFSDNHIDKQGGKSKEDYLNHLALEFDTVYEDMWYIEGSNTSGVNDFALKVYTSSSALFNYFGGNKDISDIYETALCVYGNLLNYFHCMEDLTPIAMCEKGKTKHTLSELHSLVDYIKEHKQEMPPKLQSDLDSGMLQYLDDLGMKHEDEIVYKQDN